MNERSTAKRDTLVLSRDQVADLLDLDACIDAVEAALFAHAHGETIPPGVLGAHVEGGGFHLKTAGLKGDRPYFAAKLNGNFYDNVAAFGLPRIQGLIVLCDTRNGYPLAVMDSVEITALRTAAATAVAAKYLAREGSTVATICGCGVQGQAHLDALCRVRTIETVFAVDRDPKVAGEFARIMEDRLGLQISAVPDVATAGQPSDICITCTPSQNPILGPTDVRPGCFIAAVGADSEEKQELDPELFRTAALVVDHLDQCATIGELHHALDAGVLDRGDVRAELHEVVAGQKPGRQSDDEIIVYDSTGIALQDVAAAALVFEAAQALGIGTSLAILG